MSSPLRPVLSLLAAIAAVLAPISAQADTRAGDYKPYYLPMPIAQPDLPDRSDDGEATGWLDGLDLTAVLLGAAGFMLVVALLGSGSSSEGQGNGGAFQSNGAN